MEIVNTLVAAVVAFAAGAFWYMRLADPWMRAAGVPRDAKGQPEGGQNPMILAFTFAMQLVVSGMMRHVFASSGIESIGGGLLSGLGIGLFFITPWIAINNANAMRPPMLTLIDGGYAVVACGLMGLVLTLF
ncbi:DUF1761 domain-containing protein [Antarctobacter heliothermus]|uniref:DUF1761 domain-containing protein n=1 Tax=Antarctobacter heliothermus TaxID=74033 RepID=UPI000B77DCF5|nr:DUF1761 domain-containing protein [Antarctobacter heliothermus]